MMLQFAEIKIDATRVFNVSQYLPESVYLYNREISYALIPTTFCDIESP